jgi:sirohydrochlorin cobaltochelatase
LKHSSAYLLVFHGSRDSRPQLAATALAQLVGQRLLMLKPAIAEDATAPLVETAALELAPLPLNQQIQQFAARAIAVGCHRLKLLPLFLLPGVHVMEDIPREVAIAQQALGKTIEIDLYPPIGSHSHIHLLLADPASTDPTIAPTAARVLLAHGSRRAGGNQPVAAIATQMAAIPAYWSVAPSLETQITALVKTGCQQIVILPYFLFSGGITDAIAEAVTQLDRQFPSVCFHWVEPLGASAAMADLVVDLVESG